MTKNTMDSPLPNISSASGATEAVAGNPSLNLRDNPQFIKSVVRKLQNLWKSGVGIISKAPGLTEQYDITTGDDAGEPIHRSFEWGEDFEIQFYGKSIAVRDYVADATHIVCDQSLTQAATDGVTYGDYFFTCNGRDGDNPGVIRAALNYDGETASFTAGKTLYQAATGATAKILSVTDSGTTGIIYLGDINGRFDNDEALTEIGGTGAAVANGTLYFVWAEQTNIPKCNVLDIYGGNRLELGDTENNRSEVLRARVDQESGIPFSAAADYTQSSPTLPDEASSTTFKNAGAVVALGKYSNLTIPIFDHGSAGFDLGQINADGVGMTQLVNVAYQNVDWGGSRAIKAIDEGLIYTNPYGIHIKRPSGSSDERFSFKDETISDVLGTDIFDDFDTTNADIVEDKLRGLIIVNARENSSSNNIQIVFQRKKDLRGFAIWDKALGSLYERNNEVYATDAAATKIYKLDYSRGDDDGTSIGTRLEYELKIPAGALVRPNLVKLEGKFSQGEEIEVIFDIKKPDGTWIENSAKHTITAPNGIVSSGGVGIGGTGEEGVGSITGEFNPRPNSFFAFPVLTDSAIGIRASVQTASKNPHHLTLFAVRVISKGELRQNFVPINS